MNEEAVYRKVSLRPIPLMMVLYLIAFLDRVNIGFAALTMTRISACCPCRELHPAIFMMKSAKDRPAEDRPQSTDRSMNR